MADRAAQLEPELISLLDRLRTRIRTYVWIEGASAVVAILGAAFWVSLLLDWSLEPPAWVRVVVAFATLVGAVAVAYRLILRRAFVPLEDRSLALLLERKFPQFADSLVTAVELRGPLAGEHQDFAIDRTYDPQMLVAAREKAVAQAQSVELGPLFRPQPLIVAVALMLVLCMATLALAAFAPSVMQIWAQRNLLLSNTLWPRKTRLVIDGFDSGVMKVARGSDLQILVKADTSKEVVPESVRVRFVQEQNAQQAVMTRVGEASYPQDEFQQYTYTFKSILSTIAFDIRGGDDRIQDLRIEAVDSPLLTEMTLNITPPEYTGRSRREQRVSGIMTLPEGSNVSLAGKSNKPLSQVTLHRLQGDKTELLDTIEVMQGPNDDQVRYLLGAIRADQTLLLTLLDQDGISSREPVRLVLSAQPDEAPRLNVRLRSIGQAITSQAVIPLAGEISDDFGIGRVWFEYAVDGANSAQQEILAASQPQDHFDRLEMTSDNAPALDVRSLGLAVGQKLTLSVKAADLYALADAPHVASGEQYSLEVVSGPQLLATLEARELMLRRRLESAIELISLSRGGLQETTFAESTADAQSESATDAASRRLIAVRRSLGDAQQTETECQSLATAFAEIHEELLNNRLDATEKQTRLLDGIAVPLRRLAIQDFPELQARLRRLESSIDNHRSGQQRLTESLAQCDVVLEEMNKVLEQMLKLEDFNQLVEMLRDVIELQEELNAQTVRKQKESARDLLE